ncbi:PREDICTED: CWF19-like protein 1 [Priapulus caudatus]|uniref:CWF19-like protein 1 n=1 Tax=Priapulus caudatus TaxID=37621 RepID=A0ABM1DZ77_PRICU|nr:PREDICTED: CWF19-like protein 1 [Priapulus caudatus]
MASDRDIKIIVCGDVKGQFKSLFNRVTSINKKNGPFEMLLCVGEFFAASESAKTEWEDCVRGNINVPLSTFILGANETEYGRYYSSGKEGELCRNITYLGKKGLFSAGSGLKIAYLSGQEQHNEIGSTGGGSAGTGGDSQGLGFAAKDVTNLLDTITQSTVSNGVDILLTSQWPSGVSNYTKSPVGLEESNKLDSRAIAQLALALKPRYHFAGSKGIYFERHPYRNHKILAETAQHVTRFIGLADYGNSSKYKAMYAFTVTPMVHICAADLYKQPEDVTECPYHLDNNILEAGGKTKKSGEAVQFFYDTSERGGDARHRKKRPVEGEAGWVAKKRPQATGPCWFCLGGKEVENHLVVSVGETTYLALAKGGLVSDHVMILPIEHHQSITQCPEEVLEEINKYKLSLVKYFKAKDQGVLFFERNYKTQHLQIQAVPYPMSKHSSVKDAITNYADSKDIQLDELPKYTSLKQVVQPGAPYFYLELDTEDKFLHRIRKAFPLQFGREVAASPSLLNMEERADWKACAQSKQKETDLSLLFKKAFQPFDFNYS